MGEVLVIIGIGIFNLTLAGLIIFKKQFAERYVMHSTKAYIWRKIFGEDRALRVIKNILAPVSLVLGIVIFSFGVYLFFQL